MSFEVEKSFNPDLGIQAKGLTFSRKTTTIILPKIIFQQYSSQ